jgi:hypothetical protein
MTHEHPVLRAHAWALSAEGDLERELHELTATLAPRLRQLPG